jgi:LDH2 family malate/lactate/ureidoglycolate dehydrogenase
MSESIWLSWSEVNSLARAAIEDLGYDADQADTVARHLLAAEAGGLDALGLARIEWISQILEAGAPPGDPSRVLYAEGNCILVDGHGGIGYLATERALLQAGLMAKRDGVALAGVRDVFLTGALRSYCDDLARRGLASILVSSAAPAFVAPGPGGHRVLGTNPIAIGVPGEPLPLLFDTSSTDLSYSEVTARAHRGEDLPDGVGLDRMGRRTTSADDVVNGGALLGWASHRGFGLATAVQALAMMLGVPATPRQLSDCGLLAVVIDPSRWGMNGVVDVGSLFDAVLEAAGPQGARLPGQQWHARRLSAQADGLEVAVAVVTALRLRAGDRC